MSDNGLENDLFGGSDDGAPPQPPSPVASSSRGSPKPEQSGTVTPAVDNNEDDEGGNAVDDLFGDDDDDRPASPRHREGTSPDTPVSLRSSRSPNPLEYAEEDVREPEQEDQSWASMPFPQWDGLQPTDGKIWQMRLPAYVNMESTPYESNLFRAGIEPIGEEEDVNVKRSRMISVRNTIRWKWVTGDDGEPKRQTNSRLLRWSDGSVSLQLGSDLYDLAPSYGTTLARSTDPPPKNSLPEKPPGANTTFLAYTSTSDEVLMTENTIAGQVSLVPASSSSKTHIELVKHVGQQHVKHSRMKVLEEVVDPEKAHVAATGTGGKRRTANRSGGGGGGGSRARKLKRDSSDEEEDYRFTYDADAPRRGGARGGPKGYEAEYDEDDGFVVADSDKDGEGEQEEEGDDDGDYGGGSSKKSKRKSKAKKRKGSEELDEMEEMERRIEASEREKKRARRDRKEKSRRRDYETDEDDEEPATAPQTDKDADGEEEDMDMDVESEED